MTALAMDARAGRVLSPAGHTDLWTWPPPDQGRKATAGVNSLEPAAAIVSAAAIGGLGSSRAFRVAPCATVR